MRNKKLGRLAWIGTAAGAIAFGIAGAAVGSAVASSTNDSNGHPVYTIETNASGQTYGSVIAAPPSAPPDLILAIGDSGVEGYIYAADLLGDEPASPAEALAQQKKPDEVVAVLDVYLSDGVTKIDTYTIRQGGAPVETR